MENEQFRVREGVPEIRAGKDGRHWNVARLVWKRNRFLWRAGEAALPVTVQELVDLRRQVGGLEVRPAWDAVEVLWRGECFSTSSAISPESLQDLRAEYGWRPDSPRYPYTPPPPPPTEEEKAAEKAYWEEMKREQAAYWAAHRAAALERWPEIHDLRLWGRKRFGTKAPGLRAWRRPDNASKVLCELEKSKSGEDFMALQCWREAKGYK